jgi:hypothetical protein
MTPALPLLILGLVQARPEAQPPRKPAKKPAAKATAAPSKAPEARPAARTAPDAPVAYACTLGLKGSLNTKKSFSEDGAPTSPLVNVEARQETFEVQVAGRLREVPAADGSVEFVFEPDPGSKPTGFVDASISVVGPGGSEQRTFKAREFQPMGPMAFRARYRGQAVYAAGTAFNAIGEADVSVNGGPAARQRRLHDLGPLQDLRKDEKDFRAPSLAFTGLSLWALRNSPGNFTVQGALPYQVNTKALQITGRVEVSFRIGARLPDPPAGEAKQP